MWQDVFIMAEEFKKYKSILDQEQEEFKWQLEREVSASPVFSSRQWKQYLN